MDGILAGLDAVDWPSYEHAYGTAQNTPDRLRGASAGEENAVFELLASLFHQGGGVYPAAVPAMPFLIALGCGPAVPERIAVLDLLGLFTGLLSDMAVKGRKSPASVALRAVVEEALPRLVALLDDPDPAVRREAVNKGSGYYGRYYFPLDDTPGLGSLLARMQEHADLLDLSGMRPTQWSDPAPRPHEEPSEARLRALVASPERQLGCGGWRGIAEDDEAVEIAVAVLGGNRRAAS